MKISRVVIFTLLTASVALQAGPEKEVTPPPMHQDVDYPSGLIFQIENDLWGGSDEYYTSGLRLAYAWEVDTSAAWFNADVMSLSLAQIIENPSDMYAREVDPNDRPYAGYLHLGLAWHDLGDEDHLDRVRQSFGLDLGVVGPSSLGEDAQNAYHDFRDIERPRGWEEQIKDEPILQFSYEAQLRPSYVTTPTASGFEWDQLLIGGANLGNGFINAELGTELRAGWNLRPRWAVSLVSPGSAAGTQLPWAEGYYVDSPTLGVEVFAGARGRLVGRDITLDGNTFEDSASVDKNVVVGDFYAGLGWSYGWFSMTFTETFRTEEFEGQEGGQFFGSLTLGITF